MFVGRKEEINILENLYKKNSFQFVVMYGRRRVGKTTLINEFIKNKKAIFFAAQEANDYMNLNMFSEKVYSFFNLPSKTGAFANWNDAFSFIVEKAKEEKFILAIDEFPYIAQSNKSIKSILQNIIDHELKDTSLFLILCGSQIGFMENEVLGYKSPLFGRRTSQMKVEGFNYYDASLMMKEYSNEDKVKFYGTLGGTPHYLDKIDTNSTYEDNIKDLFFSVSSYFYDEPIMLLLQELRDPYMYNSIISAVANGANRLNDISIKINEDRTKTIRYINTLLKLKILNKVVPFGENVEKSRKGIYKISDYCYRFWYKYIFVNRTGIEKGIGNQIADNILRDEMTEYIGKYVFEEVCKQYIIIQNVKGKLPFLATNFGSWWGNDKVSKKQTDIDVIADSISESSIIICECKWRNQIDEIAEIKKLMSKGKLMPNYKEQYFMFFSKVDFSEKAKNFERENSNLKLVSLDMLFDI